MRKGKMEDMKRARLEAIAQKAAAIAAVAAAEFPPAG